MIHNDYTPPTLLIVECTVEAGYSLSGVEAPDFDTRMNFKDHDDAATKIHNSTHHSNDM